MSDLIRREDAIDIVDELFALGDCYCDRFSVVGALRGIPSAEPERTKGEWIEYPDCLQYDGAYADDQIVCSVCHHVFSILDNCTEEFDFCPYCGADMRGE